MAQKIRIQQYNWLQPNNLLDQWNECIDSTQKRMNIDRGNIVVIASQAELLHFNKQSQLISINIASLLLDHLSISEVRRMCLAPGTAKKNVDDPKNASTAFQSRRITMYDRVSLVLAFCKRCVCRQTMTNEKRCART